MDSWTPDAQQQQTCNEKDVSKKRAKNSVRRPGQLPPIPRAVIARQQAQDLDDEYESDGADACAGASADQQPLAQQGSSKGTSGAHVARVQRQAIAWGIKR